MKFRRGCLSAAIAVWLFVPSLAVAQHVQVIQWFDVPTVGPFGRMTETADGSLYGGLGGISRLAPNGDVIDLHRFEHGFTSGALTLGGDGRLYGAVNGQGSDADFVFRFDAATRTLQVLHELAPASEGARPLGALVKVGPSLFGLTEVAPEGAGGWTVFRVSEAGGAFETLLVRLNNQPGTIRPVGGIVATPDGRLFGLASPVGAAAGGDRVYRFDPATRTIDAVFPLPFSAAAIFATSDGWLYGRASGSVIFRVDPSSGAVETVFTLPFIGQGVPQACDDLVEGSDGHLYGARRVVGSNQGGLFRLRRAGAMHTYEALRTMTVPQHLSPSADGFVYGFLSGTPSPYEWQLFRSDALERGGPPDPLQFSVVFTSSSLQSYRAPSTPAQASDGFLYGTLYLGGAGSRGAAYRLDATSGSVTILGDVPGPDPNGFQSRPILGDLVQGSNGFLYGTSVVAGATRTNRVIRLDPGTGAVAVAANVPGSDPEGVSASTSLTRAASGLLYGVTRFWDHASVFRFDPDTNGLVSVAAMSTPLVVAQTTSLTVGADGQLYGAYVLRTATSFPFTFNALLYRVNESAGTFESVAPLGAVGSVSNVVSGADGALYFVAGLTVVAVTPATGARRDVCTLDGGGIVYGLARGPDDALYGFMGPPAATMLFRCDPATGAVTRLEQLHGSVGVPQSALALASDGFLYGASWTRDTHFVFATAGGPNGGGAIIRVAVAGLALPAADSDGDGLPNTWETTFGLNPSSATADGGPAGDPDGDGVTNAQEFAAGTHPRGFAVRYFAEGATGSFFRTRLSLLNPRSFTANVLVRFLTDTGSTVSQHLVLPAGSGHTIDVATLPALASANFSTVVESDQPLIVDRTMSWDATGYGSHSETGVAAPSTTWYLAEGSTSGDFALFYLLQNPQDTAVTASVTYLLPAGSPPVTRSYHLAPRSRTTIQVDAQPGVESTDVSASISATAPIIVERAMYLSKPGRPFAAGHESAGVTGAALEWFLAEGATGPFFDAFVLIANPNAQPAQITVEYLLLDGAFLTKSYTVAPNARFTIWVDDEQLPAGSGQRPLANVAVSMTVRSTNNVPIVVERTMWWPGPELTSDFWYEAHHSPGTTATASRWAFADGEVGGANAAETYVLIANPAATVTQARVTVVFPDGTTLGHDYTLAARSRYNVPIGATFPGTAERRFGVIVESVGGPAPLVVERATYASPGAVPWASGTNALAAPVP